MPILMKVINWSYIALSVVSIMALYRMNPENVNFANILVIVPCAASLVALRSDSSKAAWWIAVVLNGLYCMLGFGVAMSMAGGKPDLLLGLLLIFLMAPYILNTGWFIRLIFRKPAPSEGA